METNSPERVEKVSLTTPCEPRELLDRAREESVTFSLGDWGFENAVLVEPNELEIMRQISCVRQRRMTNRAIERASCFFMEHLINELKEDRRSEPKHIPVDSIFEDCDRQEDEDRSLKVVLERLLEKKIKDLSEEEVFGLKESGDLSLESAFKNLLEKKVVGLGEKEASTLKERLEAKLERIREKRFEGLREEEASEIRQNKDRSFGRLLARLFANEAEKKELLNAPRKKLKSRSVLLEPDGKFSKLTE